MEQNNINGIKINQLILNLIREILKYPSPTEDQVRLFIYSNKEIPQKLEELLAKEKSKEYIKKQKRYKKRRL